MGAATSITASMLYNLVSCPHRVSMDLFADPAERDELSPFVELLWQRGALHEQAVMEETEAPFLDLTGYGTEDRERLTEEAMARGEALIYGGRISAADLLGVPDLLRREGGGYIPGDIKSGRGEEGPEANGRPKKHYAVQLALYVDILERKGLSAGRRGFIWDVHREEIAYDYAAAQGARNPRTLWDEYQACLDQARSILARGQNTLPAYAGVCKLCHWYSACQARLKASDDLTLIPELGRTRRDLMLPHMASIHELAQADLSSLFDGEKTLFPGIGAGTLTKFQRRARLLCDAGGRPYLREPVSFPDRELEIFFDIEVDPLREVCYLHGFIERRGGDNDSERYVAFFTDAPTPAAEAAAFQDAWQYLQDSQPCVIYYYSKYERTLWRALCRKYPEVCSEHALEALFDPAYAIDLYYDVVLPKTEWPTNDYSIKTLAKYLGFRWRDTNPSGAASIEWFDRWVETGDPAIKQRILDYNEDDCRATRILLDGIRSMRTLPASAPRDRPAVAPP